MTQRLPPSLTPLDVALAATLRGLEAVAPVDLPLSEALGCIAAEMPPLAAYPRRDIAVADGWALRASDLVGASSYSPLPLPAPPDWVESGDAMPDGCDCVLDPDAVDTSGPTGEVLAEGVPGQGVRRAGHDIVAGSSIAAAGCPVTIAALMLARSAAIDSLRVRRPRLRLVTVPGNDAAAQMIADHARVAGADVTVVTANARDAASIARALDTTTCDLVLTIGGTGVGNHDHAVSALAELGEVLAYGIALQPGRTAALGTIAGVPVIALPGAPDQAFSVWVALVRPVLDRLSARQPHEAVTLPLARKIASHVGLAEIALVAEEQGTWLPLAVGDLSLQAIARAHACLVVPGDSEGFAAGERVDAYLLRE
jgi:molybdopterin biosynthesis enzyme